MPYIKTSAGEGPFLVTDIDPGFGVEYMDKVGRFHWVRDGLFEYTDGHVHNVQDIERRMDALLLLLSNDERIILAEKLDGKGE